MEQKRDVDKLLAKFVNVTKDTPGKTNKATNKATHKIRTLDTIWIRQKPYRIPSAYKEKVMEKLEEMEKNRIIKVNGYHQWLL